MRLLRIKEVSNKTGFSVATCWRRSRDDPDFPKPVSVSPGITSWVESEVDEYIHRLVQQRRGVAA